MRAGRLRHRVQFQRRVPGYDGAGQPVENWVTIWKAWAAVEPVSGREMEIQLEDGAKVTHQVHVRWKSDLLPVDRIVHRGRHLYVESVIDRDERRKELTMAAEERVE